MGSNVMTGSGCERDAALRGAGRGAKEHVRAYNFGVAKERVMVPMGKEVRHSDLRKGDLASLDHGCAVPLDEALGCAGLVEQIGEDRGRYMVALITRGALMVRIEGLSKDTQHGQPVSVLASGQFTLATGGIPFGELLAIESVERSMGIVGFRNSTDQRPFEMSGGSRRGGMGRGKA